MSKNLKRIADALERIAVSLEPVIIDAGPGPTKTDASFRTTASLTYPAEMLGQLAAEMSGLGMREAAAYLRDRLHSEPIGPEETAADLIARINEALDRYDTGSIPPSQTLWEISSKILARAGSV